MAKQTVNTWLQVNLSPFSQMDPVFHTAMTWFCYKNQCHTQIKTDNARVTRRVKAQRPLLRVNFDRRLKLEYHGCKITSDGGLLAYRELDDALRLTDMVGDGLDPPR